MGQTPLVVLLNEAHGRGNLEESRSMCWNLPRNGLILSCQLFKSGLSYTIEWQEIYLVI